MNHELEIMESLISDISEDNWCAGWLIGIEHLVFDTLFRDGPDRLTIDGSTRDKLIELRYSTSSWLIDRGMPVSIEAFEKLHDEWLATYNGAYDGGLAE